MFEHVVIENNGHDFLNRQRKSAVKILLRDSGGRDSGKSFFNLINIIIRMIDFNEIVLAGDVLRVRKKEGKNKNIRREDG